MFLLWAMWCITDFLGQTQCLTQWLFYLILVFPVTSILSFFLLRPYTYDPLNINWNGFRLSGLSVVKTFNKKALIKPYGKKNKNKIRQKINTVKDHLTNPIMVSNYYTYIPVHVLRCHLYTHAHKYYTFRFLGGCATLVLQFFSCTYFKTSDTVLASERNKAGTIQFWDAGYTTCSDVSTSNVVNVNLIAL